MHPEFRPFIERLHAVERRCVIAVTGGGASAVAALLEVPGASRTVLEVIVPYAERSLVEFLGRVPEQFCSETTAQALAQRAWERAAWLTPGEAVVGVGCTAGLATDRPKRGDHRFHLASHTPHKTSHSSLILNKGARDRSGEELVLDCVLLNLLAEAFGLSDRLTVPLLPGEQLEEASSLTISPIAALLRGEIPAVCIDRDGRATTNAPHPAALLSGSFNPVHEGHWRLLEVAERRYGSVAFELSVVNVDKPTLTAEEVMRRLAQFAWRTPVWLTRAPTFVEKARHFPNTVFAVGVDTAERVVQPRYYGGSEEKLHAALTELRSAGCRFLVAGRDDAHGRFVQLSDLALPPGCQELFVGVPESEFHVDRSSTELRGASRKVVH